MQSKMFTVDSSSFFQDYSENLKTACVTKKNPHKSPSPKRKQSINVINLINIFMNLGQLERSWVLHLTKKTHFPCMLSSNTHLKVKANIYFKSHCDLSGQSWIKLRLHLTGSSYPACLIPANVLY